MTNSDIQSQDTANPARYACHTFFTDGRREAFWSDDRAAVLARFETRASGAGVASVIAFDFEAAQDLKLFFADDGRSLEDIRRASDEALERMIDELHARGG